MGRPVRSGEEQDAFTPWRRYLHWKPGERKQIKRRANRRERHEARISVEREGQPEAFFDAHDLAVIGAYEELETLEGECRHGCNGDDIVCGYASETCDFLCHQGLDVDEEKAERFAARVRDRQGAGW